MSSKFKAQRELDKAEALLKTSNANLEKILSAARKGTNIGFDIADFTTKSKVGKVILFVENGILKSAIDTANQESITKQIMGLIGDGVQNALLFLVKNNGLGLVLSIALELTEKDLSSISKKIYDLISDDDNDGKKIEITDSGFLQVTMPDGEVYARPFMPNAQGSLIGKDKDDVLFGGNGDDYFNSYIGNDILIGNGGNDDYNINGDTTIEDLWGIERYQINGYHKVTIRDNDGKGSILLRGRIKDRVLVGGVFDKKTGYYLSKDGLDRYKLEGSDLIINNDITIKNFNQYNNDLGIELVDEEPLKIEISNPTFYEDDKKGVFTISINKALEQDFHLSVFTENGTAIGGKDFISCKNKILVIPAGQTSAEFEVELIRDGIKEEKEEFGLFVKYTNNDENGYKGKDLGLISNIAGIATGTATLIDCTKDECPEPMRKNPQTYGSGSSGGSYNGSNYTPKKVEILPPDVPFVECDNIPGENQALTTKFNRSRSAFLAPLPSLVRSKETTTTPDKIYFDMNADGFKERMLDWFGTDEAVLVHDTNKNGIVDNGSEILGTHYNHQGTLDILGLLESFDTNGDNILDSKDNSGLALWIDKNHNAKTDQNELIYLNQADSPLKSISLSRLDKLLSGYDRNHDLKITPNDTIYSHIYTKANNDDTIDLYIYGGDEAKAFLGAKTKDFSLMTNKGEVKVKNVVFYQDKLELNKSFTENTNKNTLILGNDYANELQGNSGDDILQSLGGDDMLVGDSGNDKLIGGDGYDTLIGGKGNDILEGGAWDDSYVYNLGDGTDIIYDISGNDTLRLNFISKDKVEFIKKDGSLILYLDPKNQILIKDYFGSGKIEKIEFNAEKSSEILDFEAVNGLTKEYNTADFIESSYYNDLHIVGKNIISSIKGKTIYINNNLKNQLEFQVNYKKGELSIYLDKDNEIFISDTSKFDLKFANGEAVKTTQTSHSKMLDEILTYPYVIERMDGLDLGDGIKNILINKETYRPEPIINENESRISIQYTPKYHHIIKFGKDIKPSDISFGVFEDKFLITISKQDAISINIDEKF